MTLEMVAKPLSPGMHQPLTQPLHAEAPGAAPISRRAPAPAQHQLLAISHCHDYAFITSQPVTSKRSLNTNQLRVGIQPESASSRSLKGIVWVNFEHFHVLIKIRNSYGVENNVRKYQSIQTNGFGFMSRCPK